MPRLTEVLIRNTRPEPGGDVLIADGGCLFLRVRAGGSGVSRNWVVRVKRGGTRRVHTLGSYPEVPIKQARAEAARIVALEHGTAQITVGEAVEQYMKAIIRPKYRRTANAEVYARRLQAALGSHSLETVRPFDVSRMVADYGREAPVASMRMLGFVRKFFAWAVGFGYLERSPVTDIQARAFGVQEEARERILSDDEVRAMWRATDQPHRPLLRFLLLTGMRIGEAQASQAEWLDAEGWLHLPASVMKNKKPHRVFVSPLARAQIERDAAPALFRSVSPTAVQAAVQRWQTRHGVTDDRWTPHDLRRSFASRCGDLDVAPHVIAKALAHTFTPSESLPVYLRSEWLDERKQAAIAMAAHVATVVALPAKAAA
jgi:integrase